MWIEIRGGLVNLDQVTDICVDNKNLKITFSNSDELKIPYSSPEKADEAFESLLRLLINKGKYCRISDI